MIKTKKTYSIMDNNIGRGQMINTLTTSAERAYAEGFIKARLEARGVSRELIAEVWEHGIRAAEDDEFVQEVRG